MRITRVNPFIRAHGASAGPLMRPKTTGLLASAIAGCVVCFFFWIFGILIDLFNKFGINFLVGLIVYNLLVGVLYGAIYRRAANDRRGGWIFGASSGFIFWMVNPLIWVPWFGGEAVLVGQLGLMVLLMHVIHGALMGLIFPWAHLVCARKWTDLKVRPTF